MLEKFRVLPTVGGHLAMAPSTPSTHAKGESFRDRRAGWLARLKPTLVWKVCITQPRYREKSMAVTFFLLMLWHLP